MRLNPNQTNTLKRWKDEENRFKTLRFNLLEGEMVFASSELNEYGALVEYLQEMKGGNKSWFLFLKKSKVILWGGWTEYWGPLVADLGPTKRPGPYT